MKKVMVAVQVIVLILSTAMALGIDRINGIFEFMAVSYGAALVVFFSYAYVMRSRLEDAITNGFSPGIAARLVLTPTILAVIACLFVPVIALMLAYPESLLTDIYPAFEGAWLVNTGTVALLLSMFTSLKIIVLTKVPAYVLALAIASVATPVLYVVVIGLFALRQRKNSEENAF